MYADKRLSLVLGVLLAFEAIFGAAVMIYLSKLEHSTLLAPNGCTTLTPV